MQDAAVVGAGGAGFPAYAKLAEGADTLLINASECEPLLETDYMLMRDHMAKVLDGASLVMECASIPRTLLCLKEHNAHRLSLTDGAELAPHKICGFVYELANQFNSFYHETKIMSEEKEAQRDSYIALLNLTLRVMECGIDLLGFTAPEKM